MKRYSIAILLTLLSLTGFSQTVLMHQDVNDTALGRHGPNLRNFSHVYIGLGFILGKPDSAGSSIRQGRSTDFVLGYRYKFRISNFFAIGYDIDFNSYSYSLKQSAGKTLPNDTLHNKEQMNFDDLGLSGYMRFNYGKRGNRVGNFVDIGVFGNWGFLATHFTKDKKQNGNIVKTTVSHLSYINSINYGVTARVGFGRYVFFANYRLSDLFKTSYHYSELPRLTVGVQLGLHK
ncbi:MAG: hypothetical protein ABR968_08645 [Bacteroidales bacterium]|jgi:hypothetical protein